MAKTKQFPIDDDNSANRRNANFVSNLVKITGLEREREIREREWETERKKEREPTTPSEGGALSSKGWLALWAT